MLELLVRGGWVVTPAGVRRADLGVEGGKIAALEPELLEPAAEELDATGLHLFPGLIDVHVHFNEPGRESWEGLASGSAALAAGGGTVFFDMPLNSDPPLLDAAAFGAKLERAQAESLTDFALWGGLTPESLERLEELAEAGVIGFKAFMAESGIPEFRAADDFTLFEGMRRAAALSLPVAVHAENDALSAGLARRLRARGEMRAYLASRPVVAEVEAVQRACLFARETGCKLHLVHLSSAAAVRAALEARAGGADVTLETCPHYLHFSEDDAVSQGTRLKCAPPLRSEGVRRALWRALAAGEIDLVASDHSPCPPELKRGDAFAAWGGVSGVQATLRVLLAHAEAEGLALSRVAALTAANPAARFGLSGKGRLEPGCDADLALVDLGVREVVREAELLTRHPLSPYLGQPLRGRVRRTLLRGRTVVQEGQVVGPRAGKLLKALPAGARPSGKRSEKK